MPLLRPVTAAAGVVLVAAINGCSSGGSGSGTTYAIKAGDTTCDVEKTQLIAGDVAFKVENTGSDVTEVYVYGKQGAAFTRIVGEVENVGPGTSQDLNVFLSPGDYQVACKPGMVGDGIRTDLTVTGAHGSSSSTEVSEATYDQELEFSVASSGSGRRR